MTIEAGRRHVDRARTSRTPLKLAQIAGRLGVLTLPQANDHCSRRMNTMNSISTRYR